MKNSFGLFVNTSGRILCDGMAIRNMFERAKNCATLVPSCTGLKHNFLIIIA